MVPKDSTFSNKMCQVVYISLNVPISSNRLNDLIESLNQLADVDLSRIVAADDSAFSVCWLHQYSNNLSPFCKQDSTAFSESVSDIAKVPCQ